MFEELLNKYRKKSQYETNPLIKNLYTEVFSDLRELRDSSELQDKASKIKLETAKEGLVKELEVMERRDALQMAKREDSLCKRCGLPSDSMLKAAGGGVVCLTCL